MQSDINKRIERLVTSGNVEFEQLAYNIINSNLTLENVLYYYIKYPELMTADNPIIRKHFPKLINNKPNTSEILSFIRSNHSIIDDASFNEGIKYLLKQIEEDLFRDDPNDISKTKFKNILCNL